MKDGFKGIWITWEDHRRSRELSSALNVAYFPLLYNAKRPLRYAILTIKTYSILKNTRPTHVFCQNPSIILATLIVLMKTIFNYKVIVDRHSNFKFEHSSSSSIVWRIFHFLSKFTIKKSDLTIVTNGYLKDYCEKVGGKSFVLPDKLPQLNNFDATRPPDFFDAADDLSHVMVVTMFDDDEPIEEIVKAGEAISEKCRLYLTGNYRKFFSEQEATALRSSGVILTGFIDEKQYQTLMYHADLVVVLTKREHILNCGAYEAYAMNKPMVLSDTKAIREYFRFGCLYSTPNQDELARAIAMALKNKNELFTSLVEFLPQLRHAWVQRFQDLLSTVYRL